jgi:glucan phosphoethanolaminetransferase (alkaline phosphatase superfamily)
MPFELSNTFNNTFGMSLSSPGMNRLLCSKFYTSIILTFIIIILIMIIYPCKKGTPIFVTFKLGFYIMICTLSVIFLHDTILRSSFDHNLNNKENNAFVEAIGSSNNIAYYSDKINIDPKLAPVDSTIGGYVENEQPMDNAQLFNLFGV